MSVNRAGRVLVTAVRAWFALVTATSVVAAQVTAATGAATSSGDGPVKAAVSAKDEAAPGAEPAPDALRPLGETLTGDAKRDYDTALVLHRSGDFAGAGRRFASAYEATKDVRLLWNAAACEQGLRHYSKAIALVRRYLSSRSPLITDEAERNARAFLDAALPLTARLIVEVNEHPSEAFLDDELLGPLPLDAETRVDFGSHRLLVRNPHFSDGARTFTVASSADVHLALKLEPVLHQGRLVVRAGHGDAIALDGRFRSLSMFDGTLPTGKHRLRVTSTGSEPLETSVLVEDDRTRALDVTLKRSPVFRVPTWVWLASGAVLLAGAGTATYLLVRSPDSGNAALPSGSAGKLQLPLR